MSESYITSEPQGNAAHTSSLHLETQEPVATTTAGKATEIRSIHLLILGGLSALGPLSTDMYLPALPALSADLGATMSQTQATLSAGILGLALGQVIAGPSSDALGRRRPLLIGLAAFALASLLCTIATSIGALTFLRFVQGFAGAAGIAIALAIVSDLYAGTTQARFFSLLMQISGIAPIIAPIIGSQLLTFTSWHGVFVALAIIGVALFLAASFGMGETLPVERRQRGGLAATRQAFRNLLGDRRFVGYALASGFAFAAGISYISGSPFILQNIYGLSPQLLGIVFAVNAVGIVIAAQVNTKLVGTVSPQTLLTWGGIGIALSGAILLVVVLSGVGLIGILPAFFLMTSSFGLIVPNATTLALANTPTAGSASGLLGVLQLVIGAVAAPLVGMGGTDSALPLAIAIAIFGLLTLLMATMSGRPVQEQTRR
jgi:DHA1 family bicyclomycin/chloramphenicol resistance-like MFS transporter